MTILTFNIRNGHADDGSHSWPLRRHATAQVIREANAEIVCLQEVFDFQLAYLLEQLPEYAAYSVGRDDGDRAGEACSILWRKSRFAPLDQGTFWLSDMPDQPGSKSWGNNTTRVCSWVDFGTFALFNTHWDHESREARLKSAGLIHRHLPLTP
jgi:endonuclease/exonuclease/phosphatase family metal-dependent hydrolase